MNTKSCSICKEELPIENFKPRGGKRTGWQSQCISCQKEYRKSHYLANRTKYILKAKENTKKFRDWWRLYKSQFSCIKCGESHPAAIDFHHPNDDKEGNIAQLVSDGNKQRIIDEIAKCVPLCRNCHAKLHDELRMRD